MLLILLIEVVRLVVPSNWRYCAGDSYEYAIWEGVEKVSVNVSNWRTRKRCGLTA